MRIQTHIAVMAVVALLASGCVGYLQQSGVEFKSTDQGAPDPADERITENWLRQEVLRFSNRYRSAIVGFGIERIEDTARSPEDRLSALRLAYGFSSNALQISIGPFPVVNLLDMMVLTTLTRRRAEAQADAGGYYWHEDLAAIVPTLVSLETDIWDLSARVLTQEQLAALREAIDAWLRDNPNQEYVADVRIDDFSAQQVDSELAEIWTMGFIPGLNLAPELDQASAAADAMRLLFERYLVYLDQLPAILRWESQKAYYQLLIQPETKQLLSDVSQAAASTERIADFLDRLPEEEDQLRALSADLRQTILAGKEMAALVDQAVISADAFLSGIEERKAPNSREVDIIDWQDTAVEVAVAARQLNDTFAQLNALVTSPGWEQNLPQLIAVLDRAESETEEAVDHAFRQSLMLIGVFLAGSLVTGLIYQWAKRKIFASGPGKPNV